MTAQLGFHGSTAIPFTGSQLVFNGPPQIESALLLSLMETSPVVLSIHLRPPPHSPTLNPASRLSRVAVMVVIPASCLLGHFRAILRCRLPAISIGRPDVRTMTVRAEEATPTNRSPSFAESAAVVFHSP